MDSIEALAKVYDSLSRGASKLDFSPSDITGECAAQVQEIVRLRKSGAVTEDSLNKALSCLNGGNGLNVIGLIATGLGHWNCSIKAYEKAQSIFTKIGDVHGAAQTYNNLGSVYAYMGEWNKAIEFHQKSLETFEKLGDVHGAAQTYGNLGSVYYRMGEWGKAIEFHQKSLEISEKIGDVHGAAQTYNNLGLVYTDIGEWNKAIEYYQKSLETFEKLGNVHSAALTYNNLGMVYFRMGEWSKATEYYQKSLETKEKLGDVYGAAQTYGNLGLVYYRKGEWNKAIEYDQKILKTFEKLGDVHGAAQTYSNLGLVYAETGEWSKAIEYYQKSLETKEKIGDVHGKGITLSYLGKLHLHKEPTEPEVTLGYLEESIKLINKEARPDYPNALNWLALCYHKLGSMKKAQAKREKDQKKKKEFTDSASKLFSDASLRYNQVAAMPRVNLPSLQVYAHLDKGLSFSVNNITEQNECKAIALLDNALSEFKEALKYADETEKLKIQGNISDHEAKLYLRLAAVEKKSEKQDELLDKAIGALQDAVSNFERLGGTSAVAHVKGVCIFLKD